jgi:hypothetical protein
MLPSDPTALLTLVELCITQDSDNAWRQFDAGFGPSLETAFRQTARGPWALRYKEFRPWLVNWIHRRRVLHAAYRKMSNERVNGALSTDQQQSDFLANYLAKATRNSAVPEFITEFDSPLDPLTDQATALCAPETQMIASIEMPDDLWQQLDRDYRVPFWLRHISDLGFPPVEDVAWMSAQSGKSEDEVRRLIDEEINASDHAAFPIDASLIAQLCGIPQSPDGSYSTVDQRVRRARLQLRKKFPTTGRRQ